MARKPSDREFNKIQTIINKSRHPKIVGLDSKQKAAKVMEIWKKIKSSDDWDVRMTELHSYHLPYLPSKNTIKTKSITDYFKSKSSSSSSNLSSQSSSNSSSNSSSKPSSIPQPPTSLQSKQTHNKKNRTYTAPKQEQIKAEIEEVTNKITTTTKHCSYFKVMDQDEYIKHKSHLTDLKATLKKLKYELTTKQRLAQTQKRWRDKQRRKKVKIKKKMEDLGIDDELDDDIASPISLTLTLS